MNSIKIDDSRREPPQDARQIALLSRVMNLELRVECLEARGVRRARWNKALAIGWVLALLAGLVWWWCGQEEVDQPLRLALLAKEETALDWWEEVKGASDGNR